MKPVIVEIDGNRVPVFFDRIGETLWVHYQGQTFSTVLGGLKSKRRRGTLAAETPDILAPMPGKITQVLCQKNESVKTGQVLIVMEAMKMEYNLKASKAGDVAEATVKVGDQVVLGQVLVKIKA